MDVRYANGTPYELNCSLPDVFSSIAKEYFYDLIEQSIAFIGILNSYR